MRPVKSLVELRMLSEADPRYRELTIRASCQLGGRADATLEMHQQWLRIYALATSEEDVLQRINLLMSGAPA